MGTVPGATPLRLGRGTGSLQGRGLRTYVLLSLLTGKVHAITVRVTTVALMHIRSFERPRKAYRGILEQG